MFSTMRAAAAALLVGIVGLGTALAVTGERTTIPTAPAEQASPGIAPTELLDITFDGAVIPEDFVGVLFSRKTYPTDQQISYSSAFLPPNTFVRHVEAGELGIRPNSDTQVIRAGSTWQDAETVGAGDEATIGAGDTFVQRDVPWQEFGKDALGEMWTPGEDAVIVSIAIRERERCCSMSHLGMVSRWYHTLTNGVQELSDAPMVFRVLRWEIPTAGSMTRTVAAVPSLWAVDAGVVTARHADEARQAGAGEAAPTTANNALWPMSLEPGVEMIIENVGQEPVVLYELLVEPADRA